MGVELRMTHTTEVRILDATPSLTDSYQDFVAGLRRAQISAVWISEGVPIVVEGTDDMYLLHGIEPFLTGA